MSTYLSNTIYQCLQNTEAAFCLVTIVRSHHGKYNTTSRERDRYVCVFHWQQEKNQKAGKDDAKSSKQWERKIEKALF